MQLTWKLFSFNELDANTLYALLRLRSEVFVVEQQCVFLDMDNYDQGCWHLLGYSPGTSTPEKAELVAYTRLVPPGLIYEEISIGRVVTAPAVRRLGAGRALMQESLLRCRQLFGNGPIRLGAQQYLEQFYGSFGFQTVGAPYLEDGIWHVYMVSGEH